MGMTNLVCSRLQYPHVQTHTRKTWVLSDGSCLTVRVKCLQFWHLDFCYFKAATLSLAVGIAAHFPPHEHLCVFSDEACKHAIKWNLYAFLAIPFVITKPFRGFIILVGPSAIAFTASVFHCPGITQVGSMPRCCTLPSESVSTRSSASVDRSACSS